MFAAYEKCSRPTFAPEEKCLRPMKNVCAYEKMELKRKKSEIKIKKNN
jgi:ribosomal protein S21